MMHAISFSAGQLRWNPRLGKLTLKLRSRWLAAGPPIGNQQELGYVSIINSLDRCSRLHLPACHPLPLAA
jgi:hypothetical protein